MTTPAPAASPDCGSPQKPDLRHAFGRFATGIAVITTLDEQGAPYGLTVNSFTSVSMAPPMISWNVIRGSRAHAVIRHAGRFVVNILARDQLDVARRMTGPNETRFHQVGHRLSRHGLPILDGTLATFECTVHSLVTAGDHDIVLGGIDDFAHRDGPPLVYWRGAYTTAQPMQASCAAA